MRALSWIATAVLLAFSACEKKTSAAHKPAAESVAADGTRQVPIAVEDDGYHPDKINAKAGSKLNLLFTRHSKASCGSQVKIADGKLIDLPLGKEVAVPVDVPQSGQVTFVCGMDMMTGTIVVD